MFRSKELLYAYSPHSLLRKISRFIVAFAYYVPLNFPCQIRLTPIRSRPGRLKGVSTLYSLYYTDPSLDIEYRIYHTKRSSIVGDHITQLMAKEVLATWLADLIRCNVKFQATQRKKEIVCPIQVSSPGYSRGIDR